VKRTLTLKSESLAPLTAGEMSGVGGGAQALPTTPVQQCYDDFMHTKRATQCFCP
jgi:hypothetical protein